MDETTPLFPEPEKAAPKTEGIYDIPLAEWKIVQEWLDDMEMSDWHEMHNDRSSWEQSARSVKLIPVNKEILPLDIGQISIRKHTSSGSPFFGPKHLEEVHLSIGQQSDYGIRPLWSAEFSPDGHFYPQDPRFYDINRLPPAVAEGVKSIVEKYEMPTEVFIDDNLAKHIRAFQESRAVLEFYNSQESTIEKPNLDS